MDPTVSLRSCLMMYEGFNIAGHVRPDWDCVGAAGALARVLHDLGRAAHVILNNGFTDDFIALLAGVSLVRPEDCNAEFPLIIVDCASIDRVGDDIMALYSLPLICIDHHPIPDGKRAAKWSFVDERAASCTQVVARLLFDEGLTVGADVASMLFMGILGDTIYFRGLAVSAETWNIAAELVRLGARQAVASGRLSAERRGVLGAFLAGIRVEDGVAWGDWGPCGAAGPLNCLQWLEAAGHSVIRAEFSRQASGEMRGSFVATTSDARVHEVAQCFGGGGHAWRAGAVFPAELLGDVILALRRRAAELLNSGGQPVGS